VGAFAFASSAADSAEREDRSAELSRLRAQIEEQKRQIDALRATLEAQSRLLEQVADAQRDSTPERRSVGEVASASPMIVPSAPPYASPAAPPRNPIYVPPSAAAPQTGEPPVAPNIRIGDSYITPLGFMDMTGVFRTASTNSGIGTNFGAIPFNNTFPTARLTELRLNPQNSRFGLRFDTKVAGSRVTGYWESDFLGGSASNNLSVSSNSWVFRMRLYWVDVRKDKFEFLAGQSWSMMTPGRNGISPNPGDLFYTQDVDVNYNVGLTWGRIPGFRFVYHPSNAVHAGIAFENADQYIGGSGGGGTITLPSNLPSSFVNQLDNAANSFQTPNLHPDIIGKLAFDPMTGKTQQHIELVGLYRSFRTYNQTTNQHYTTSAGGGAINMNFEPVRNFHVLLNNFWSDGGGRYLFGNGPDLVIRADGSVSPIHAYSSLEGVELNAGPKTLIYAYYGQYYFGKNVIVDAAGKLAGYGYAGSPNSQNRSIQEPTFGFTQTFWRDPRWGALQFMLQYSWINRYPWVVLAGQPKDAHNSTVFINLRYALPGNAPAIK
jgi:hypothetical protein